MIQASRTFRIFVSSTFSDLKEERNALQERVFPKLRELCMQHGCRFQAIDLRWGVREEAGLDQQTMNICLQELKRCQKVTPRPNFIVLLGDRYGWQPLPPQIPANEFKEILTAVTKPDDRDLILCPEPPKHPPKGWYRKDLNAVLPEYYLRPRKLDIPENATEEEKKAVRDKEAEEWGHLENRMRAILLSAIDRLGWPPDDPRRIKYEASATHQEILAGALSPEVKDAHEHVFGFFRRITNLNELERDLDKPQADPDKEARNFVVHFLGPDGKKLIDRKAHGRLQCLKKQEFESALRANILDYDAKWIESGITTDHIGTLPEKLEDCLKLNEDDRAPSSLCVDVWRRLSGVILKEIAKLKADDPLDKEIADHQRFGGDRAKFFTGRTAILQSIATYIRGPDRHPLAVFGESGSGKTALVARAVKEATNNHPDAEIVYRFIGATPSSSDGRALLKSLCRQISRRYGANEANVPTDYRELVQEFTERLALAAEEKPLILFLDALDQLSDTDHARNLMWLPAELPDNVRLIVSTLPGGCLSVLEKKLPEGNFVELEPMPLNQGSELLNLWFKDAGRTLQDHQWKEVLDKFVGCGLPLYLKLAFEEARDWKSYTEKRELSPDIVGIIRDLFARLSLDTNHGKPIVSRSLAYLAAAKNGLTEDELLDVLSIDEDVLQDFVQRAFHKPPEKRLPVVVWSRLYFDLEPYLTERAADGTTLMTFYHRQFVEVVAEEFLADEAKRKRHERLAQYFRGQDLWIDKDDKKNPPNIRKVSELPYQQTYGELWYEIEQTLCDLHFIEAKCAAGMTYDLIADYTTALDALPEAQEEKQKELKHEERIGKYTQDLIAYARGDIPTLGIIPSVEPWSDEKIRKETERTINNPTRLDRIRAFSQFVNSESHSLIKFGFMLDFCLQQAYNFVNSGPVAKAAEKIIRAKEKEVFLLHHENHRHVYNPHRALIRTLEGHSDAINSVGITADGKKAVSGGNDKMLRVWNLETGESHTLEGHGGAINSVGITADGKKAVSGGNDKMLRVWNLETGESHTLEGHGGNSNSVCVSPNGRRIVSVSDDSTIRVWVLENSWFRLRHEKRTITIKDVSITPDGFTSVSCGNGALQLWNLENGTCLKTLLLKGDSSFMESVLKFSISLDMGEEPIEIVENRDYFTSVGVSADGKIGVSGTRYAGLCLWDLESGKLIRQFYGHTDTVRSVSLSANGKMMISASMDNSLRVWNVESGLSIPENTAHNYRVESICLTNDGDKAVSASYDGYFNVWDIESGDAVSSFQGHKNEVNALCITPDDKKVVSGSSDGSVKVWKLDDVSSIGGNNLFTFKGLVYPVTSLTVTSDGNRVVSACGKNPSDLFDPQSIVRLWDVKKGKYRSILEGHKNYVTAVSITSDGRLAVSGSYNELLLWDLETGKCIRAFESNTGWISSTCITPDSEKVISSGGNIIHVWDIESGICLLTLKGHASTITAIKVTPDGRHLVSGSQDGTVKIWNLKEGASIRTCQGEGKLVFLDITADSRSVVATYSYDLPARTGRYLRVWDWERGNCAAVYSADDPIVCISETDVRGHIVYGTQNGDVIILKSNNLIKHVPYVTAARIWRYDENGSKGNWDNCVTAHCVWCGQRFAVSPSILKAINDITTQSYLDDSHTNLPDRAWVDNRLLSECVHCNSKLNFNPFIVDNANRNELFTKTALDTSINTNTQKADSLFLMPPYKRYESLINIPSDAGNIADGYEQKVGNKKTIIYIQDIHANFEAQRNISRMLDQLITDTGLKLIMVEGGWGSVGLSHLRSHANRERRQAVAEKYLKAGKISGEEYFDIAYDHEIELEGIDDERLHRENTNTLFKIEDIRAKALEELLNIKTSLYELQKGTYPPHILQFERLDMDYKAEKISLKDFYLQLHEFAEKVGEDFTNFQHFRKFVEAIGMEQHIDFKLVERERENIINHIENVMPMQKYIDFILKSFKFSRGKASAPWYHNYLIDEAENTRLDSSKYGNLKRYLEYITLHESIDIYTLFSEADDLFMKVKEKLCDTKRQGVLNKISIGINILENCLNTRLIPSQFEYYMNNAKDFIIQKWIDIINREADHQDIRIPLLTSAKTLDDNLSILMRFYEIAHERAMCFVDKAIELMNRKKQDLSVIIAGGHHAPLLKQLLIKKGLSFIVVSPKTTQKTDLKHYLEVFKCKAVENYALEIQRELQDENTGTEEPASFVLDHSLFNEFDEHVNRGRQSLISGRLALSVEHYQKASELGELLYSKHEDAEIKRRLARAQLEAGCTLMYTGNWDGSLKHLLTSENILWQVYTSNRTSESTADMLRIYLFLHYCYSQIGDKQKAREQVEKFWSIKRWLENKRIRLPFEIGILSSLILGRIHLKEFDQV